MTTRQRYEYVIRWFEQNMPVAESELRFKNNYELLVAVMLSAQCTDKRVNLVTHALFKAFPDADSLSQATAEEVLRYIHSVSYPNSKARHLIGMAQMLMSDFDGIVPSDVDELMRLPGVGRKTANVIAAVAFSQPKMAVDTHIFRVAERIGLTTNSKNPRETELTLIKYIPEDIIPKAHHWLLLHGRYICQARKPKCTECGLTNACKRFENNQKKQNYIEKCNLNCKL